MDVHNVTNDWFKLANEYAIPYPRMIAVEARVGSWSCGGGGGGLISHAIKQKKVGEGKEPNATQGGTAFV